jgi:hypothetical protein
MYIHQPITVPVMRNPMMKRNLPAIKKRNSLIFKGAYGFFESSDLFK